MAIKNGARIKESSVSSGTGTITLSGALAGHRAITDALSDSDEMIYWLLDANGLGWELGKGTLIAGSPNTFSRDLIYDSSNSGSAISLSVPPGSDTHFIFSGAVPDKAVSEQDYLDLGLLNPELAAYSERLITASISAGTVDFDLALANNFELVLTENVTATTFSNAKSSGKTASFSLKLSQDATGSRTFTFPANVRFPGGTAPTLVSGADEYDRLYFVTEDGGTTWDCIHGGGAFA